MAENSVPRRIDALPSLPPRLPETHKGQAGRVGIIAGSRGMSGAAVLSGLGALRGGAGLVRVYCATSVQPIVAGHEPCLMTVPLAEDADGRIAVGKPVEEIDLDWPSVLAVGPGLGQSDGLFELVSHVTAAFAGPLVLDADALNCLAPRAGEVWPARRGRTTVLTPHPGEMNRLRRGAGWQERQESEDAGRIEVATEYARFSSAVVVLKGNRTVVAADDRTFVNTTGNAGMATGGMGDVLTGLIAALLGQGLSGFEAACLAVHVHGAAADRCAKEIGPVGYLARDVAERLPESLFGATRPQMGFHS